MGISLTQSPGARRVSHYVRELFYMNKCSASFISRPEVFVWSILTIHGVFLIFFPEFQYPRRQSKKIISKFIHQVRLSFHPSENNTKITCQNISGLRFFFLKIKSHIYSTYLFIPDNHIYFKAFSGDFL